MNEQLQKVYQALAKAGQALIDQSEAYNRARNSDVAKYGNIAVDAIHEAIDALRSNQRGQLDE